MIRILDYGANNLNSVYKAVKSLGFDAEISSEVGDPARLIIPGVGAFGQSMKALKPVADDIRRFAESGRPVMGICLGQQLLMDGSDELGSHRGLGLVPGWVKYLPGDRGLKVPHIGWTSISFVPDCPLAEGLAGEDYVYFVHSLYCHCDDPATSVATANYGIPFCAALRRDNVWGTQFHPEKSGKVGLKILENFLNWN